MVKLYVLRISRGKHFMRTAVLSNAGGYENIHPMYKEPKDILDMISEWVRVIRAHLGVNQTQFGEIFDVAQSTVSRWEKGEDMPGGDHLAKLMDVAIENELPIFPNPNTRFGLPRGVHVLGRIGAGAVIQFFDDDRAFQDDYGYVFPPPNYEYKDIAAVEVTGDSMYPIEDGWLVFYERKNEGVTDECHNKLCVVRLPDDTTVIKRLRIRNDGFDLESWNAPMRQVDEITWAAPVLDIRPRA